MFKTLLAASLAATAIAAATPAAAATFDVVSSFGAAGSAYSFGTGYGGSFTLLPNFVADNCVGVAGLACYNTPSGDYTFPAVGKNISGSDPLVFYTNVLPQNLLFMQSLPGQTATVRFTAPTNGFYSIASSVFQRIDNADGQGDGVTVGIYYMGLSTTDLPTVYGASTFPSGGAFLTAGSTVDFFVDAKSNTFNDGTGFALTFSGPIPEPATWSLMIGGFAMVGFAARRRRTAVAA